MIRANTFSDLAVEQAFCYEYVNGLMEIVVNQGSAVVELNLSISDSVAIYQ